MINPIDLLTKGISTHPPTISSDSASAATSGTLSQDELLLLHRFGITSSDLAQVVADSVTVNYERVGLYREIDNAITHPLVAAAAELYADVACTYSSLQNATVWPTGDSKYVSEIEKLFDIINLEERIFDWTWSTLTYGDLIPKINAHPGLGVVSLDDFDNPVDVSRVDVNGVLIGWYNTPLGDVANQTTQQLQPPWDYLHLRVLGAKRKRSVYGETQAGDYKTTYLITKDSKRITAKYGTSVLINSLPIYKRLRLCEDSLMMSRLTRGILRYLYKIGVSGDNISANAAIIDQYKQILKTARYMDTSAGSFGSRYDPLSSLEDVLVPVWGDVGNLTVEELGGKPDIKWIVDIEELRNQLACALRVPLPLLGGYTQEASGALGATTMEQLDIRFARSCRRVQRAIIDGLTRLCQIHFAYMGMKPDPNLFELHMPETSTAEEETLKKALDTGMDVITKVMDVLDSIDSEIDKLEVFEYLNEKILKINDFDLSAYMRAKTVTEEQISEMKNEELAAFIKEAREFMLGKNRSRRPRYLPGDTRAALPEHHVLAKLSESKSPIDPRALNETWLKQYGDVQIQIKKVKDDKSTDTSNTE